MIARFDLFCTERERPLQREPQTPLFDAKSRAAKLDGPVPENLRPRPPNTETRSPSLPYQRINPPRTNAQYGARSPRELTNTETPRVFYGIPRIGSSRRLRDYSQQGAVNPNESSFSVVNRRQDALLRAGSSGDRNYRRGLGFWWHCIRSSWNRQDSVLHIPSYFRHHDGRPSDEASLTAPTIPRWSRPDCLAGPWLAIAYDEAEFLRSTARPEASTARRKRERDTSVIALDLAA
jgi:hypothetical protein